MKALLSLFLLFLAALSVAMEADPRPVVTFTASRALLDKAALQKAIIAKYTPTVTMTPNKNPPTPSPTSTATQTPATGKR